MWDVKYRPLRFSDVLGQEGAIQILKARLKSGSALNTSYIFSGGHGQGKTTLSRILARALLCQALTEDQEPCNECDNCISILEENSQAFSELDAASKGTIEHIRAIVDNLPFAVLDAIKRIFLFDEMHRMSRDSQDVLLKPIEDKRMVGIFCTTEPEKIRGTIRSRCEEHSIRRITPEDIFERMAFILKAEGVEFEDEGVLTVIDYCQGHVRDVMNRLEMISQMGPVTLESVRGYLRLSLTKTYFEILLKLDTPAQAAAFIESACEQVQPGDVAAGIAEAAMNSYRWANNMFVDHSALDKTLAEEVHKKYGDSVIRLASRFANLRSVTRTSLVCEAILVVTAPVAQPVLSAPLMVPAAPQPVAPQAASEVAPQPTPAPTPTPAPKLPQTIGNLGDDPYAHTEVDTYGIPADHPRGSRPAKAIAPPRFDSVGFNTTMSPAEWTALFDRTWP